MDEEQSGGGVRRAGSVKKRGGGWEKTQAPQVAPGEPHGWTRLAPFAETTECTFQEELPVG